MSDLIDRQAAIDAIDRIFDRCEEIENHFREDDPDRTGYRMLPDYFTVRRFLTQQTAQPEIVRCEDCKHYDTHDHRCKVWNHGVIMMGFCHKGEREEQ